MAAFEESAKAVEFMSACLVLYLLSLYTIQPFVFAKTALVKPLHPEKAAAPILVRLWGICTLVNFESEKAYPPIVVRFAGNCTLVNPVHPLKASSSIVVRLSGNCTLVKPLQLEKAPPRLL